MKHWTVLALISFFLLSGQAECLSNRHTTEYLFAKDVLEALKWLQSGLDDATQLHDKTDKDVATMAANMLRQQGKYKMALGSLDKYIDSKDEKIVQITNGILTGMMVQAEGNRRLAERLNKATDEGISITSKGIEHELGEVYKIRKVGWGLIASSAKLLFYALKQTGDRKVPVKKLPYLITAHEKADLLLNIDRNFGSALNAYHKHITAAGRGRLGKPDDHAVLIAAIDDLKTRLDKY